MRTVGLGIRGLMTVETNVIFKKLVWVELSFLIYWLDSNAHNGMDIAYSNTRQYSGCAQTILFCGGSTMCQENIPQTRSLPLPNNLLMQNRFAGSYCSPKILTLVFRCYSWAQDQTTFLQYFPARWGTRFPNLVPDLVRLACINSSSLLLSCLIKSYSWSQRREEKNSTSLTSTHFFSLFVQRSLCRLYSTNRSRPGLSVVLPSSPRAEEQALFSANSCSLPALKERPHVFPFLNGLLVHCVQWLLFTCTQSQIPNFSFSLALLWKKSLLGFVRTAR